MEKAKRHSGIEIARIIAMLMILFSHYSIHGGFNLTSPPEAWLSVGGVNQLILSSLKYGGFGVAIFVIISGYCGINSTFKPRKVIQLIAQVCFYSWLIYIICLATGLTDFSVLDAIKNIFPILFEQYWYATAYIVLYLVSPYLNILLKSIEQEKFKKLLAIMLLLWCVIPTFTAQAMYGRQIPKFVMLYTVGAYLRLYPDNYLAKANRAKLGLVLSFILLFISSLLLQLLGSVSTLFSSHYGTFYDTESVLTVIGATCLVYLCANLNLGSNKKINMISSATFSVFLIHAHTGWRYLIWKDFLGSNTFLNSPFMIIHMIICVAVVYVLCVCIDLLRQKFVERLFMILVDRIIFKIEQKKINK